MVTTLVETAYVLAETRYPDYADDKWGTAMVQRPAFVSGYETGHAAREAELLAVREEFESYKQNWETKSPVIHLKTDNKRLIAELEIAKNTLRDDLNDWRRIQDAERECERLREALKKIGQREFVGCARTDALISLSREALKVDYSNGVKG